MHLPRGIKAPLSIYVGGHTAILLKRRVMLCASAKGIPSSSKRKGAKGGRRYLYCAQEPRNFHTEITVFAGATAMQSWVWPRKVLTRAPVDQVIVPRSVSLWSA